MVTYSLDIYFAMASSHKEKVMLLYDVQVSIFVDLFWFTLEFPFTHFSFTNTIFITWNRMKMMQISQSLHSQYFTMPGRWIWQFFSPKKFWHFFSYCSFSVFERRMDLRERLFSSSPPPSTRTALCRWEMLVTSLTLVTSLMSMSVTPFWPDSRGESQLQPP